VKLSIMTLVIMKVVMKSCYAMCLSCYVIYALCHNQALKCSCGECWAPKKHSGFSTLKMGATTNYKLQRQTTTTHNYIKHNDTQHRGFISIIQHNDTEHNNLRPTCWMSLCWVSLCWMLRRLKICSRKHYLIPASDKKKKT
jgi:hypothetical protein